MLAPRSTRLVLAAAVLAFVAGSCSTSDEDVADAASDSTAPTSTTAATPPSSTTVPGGADPDLVFPGAEWDTADATEMGIDETALETLVSEAEASGSNCLMVTRNGRMVGEWYWDGEPTDRRRTFSTAKSFTAGLVGIAGDEGALAVTDPASDYVTEWQGTDSEAVLVEDLLQNDSGRFQDFTTDYVGMALQAVDKSAFSIGLDQAHEPSTVWAYNNAAVQTLETVLERALDEPDIAAWGTENLLEPIGMANSTWLTDDAGNALTFIGIESTCRDMGRYGLLWLAGGTWDGREIISSEFVQAALEPVPTNGSYGYLWWRHDPVQPLWPSSPDTFAALGLGGQFISVDPDTGLVVTRQALGNDEGGADLLNLLAGAADSNAGLINLAGTLVDTDA